jgi:hypothetical protein
MLELLLTFLGEIFLERAGSANWSTKTRTVVDVLVGVLGVTAVIYGIWVGCLNRRFWLSVVLFLAGGLCLAGVIHRLVVYRRKKEREPKY